MNHHSFTRLLPSALLASLIFALGVHAQEPDAPAPALTYSPAVTAILETNPSTPPECIRAAKLLADFGRADLGRKYLQKVAAAGLDQAQLAALVDRFGSATFINMAARKGLAPEAKQLADAVLTAADEQTRRRVPEFIGQLKDPSPSVRSRALAELKRAGSEAVAAMVAALADDAMAADHPYIRAALIEMRGEAAPALLGLLERSEPRLMAQTIHLLGRMDAKHAVIYLLGPYASEASDPAIRQAAGDALKRLVGHLPTKRLALRLLVERSEAYFDGSRPVRIEADGLVTMWHFDAGKKQCAWTKYSAADAALVLAARLARDAYALADEDPDVRLLYLATMLEAAAYQAGLDAPLPEGEGTAIEEARRFSAEEIEDVMQYAVDRGHTAAATAAARILGESGETDALLRRGHQPSPLVRATRHPDRRLRMAAIEAVLALGANAPYPGASYVTESLAFFGTSSGTARALVASPNAESSGRVAGLLAGMGFEVDTAATGEEAMRLAIASPDYELALIDAAVDRPTADMLLSQFRNDYRTAKLRVGLIARNEHFERARRTARDDSQTLAFFWPHDDEAIRWQVGRLAGVDRRSSVPFPERQRQAAAALEYLKEISGPDNRLYDVRRLHASIATPLYVPSLSTRASGVLGNLGNAESQRALVDLASFSTQPLPIRAAALRAFRDNAHRYGILLTTDEMQRQYDRYNASADLDPKTQRILGMILDTLEVFTQSVNVDSDAADADAKQ